MGNAVEGPSAEIAALCDRFLHSPEDQERWEAADALGETGDPTVIPTLLRGITDPCEAVRLNVAYALGDLGVSNPDVTGGLCCLLTDFDAYVRRFALEALADLGDVAALPAIQTRLVAERREPMARIWVHYALYRLANTAFPLPEVFVLLRRGSSTVRISAATALPRVVMPDNRDRIRHALGRALRRETSAGMREVMERSLAALSDQSL